MDSRPEQVRTADAPPGRRVGLELGQGIWKEEGTQDTGSQEFGGGANVLRWAGRGPVVVGGVKKIRDPRNSIAAEKFKVLGKLRARDVSAASFAHCFLFSLSASYALLDKSRSSLKLLDIPKVA